MTRPTPTDGGSDDGAPSSSLRSDALRRRIVGVCGSLQSASSNLELLRAASARARGHVHVDFHISDALRALPHFDPDKDGDTPPDVVVRWRRELGAASAVLFASPEYAHSLPGVLKNGVDWVVSSGELYGKRVALTTAVRDPARGRRGLEALATTLRAVDAQIVWCAPIVIDGVDRAAQIEALVQALVEPNAATSVS